MKNNTIFIYIGLLAVGILLGWLFFGASSNKGAEAHQNHVASKDQMWTCSMHPQILQSEPGDCPICGMDLIPAHTEVDGLASNEIKMSANAMALANIQTTVVGNASNTNDHEMSLSGKIMVNEEANAVQVSYFEGRIEKLYVNFTGEEVRKGQLLATLYAPNLVAAQQELITTSHMKSSQPALYEAVRNKLKLWKLSESQINQIESSGKVRENFPIYATVSGTVSQKLAEEGDYVKQGQAIVKLSDLSTVWATFDAYENQISALKEGQELAVHTKAYPHKNFEATLSFIDPIVNMKSRTVAVRATLKNREEELKPGMFVTAKVHSSKDNDEASKISIPATAVLWTGERSLVYVKTNPNEPVFEMREVTLGTKNENSYTIIKGLSKGEEIVTNGTFTVDAAAQLQGKKSMMNAIGEGSEAITTNAGSKMQMTLPDAFQKEFQGLLPSYFKMSDAFVASDSDQVSYFSAVMVNEMKALPLGNLAAMEKAHVAKSIEMLEAMSSNSEIESQRANLVILNENMVRLALLLNSNPKKIYVQKCPMANSNKGAMWLSTEKEIKNPYYGDAMLTCGSVIDTIK